MSKTIYPSGGYMKPGNSNFLIGLNRYFVGKGSQNAVFDKEVSDLTVVGRGRVYDPGLLNEELH
jgi:hypothetical protein